MAGFLGMRGNGDWATSQRPLNWREALLRLYPNGKAPLTALLSKMKNEKVDDPEFNWWTKIIATQRATVTGVYTDAILSSAYVSGGVAGTTLYVKCAEADSGHFRVGHQVLLRLSTDYALDVNAKVTAVVKNGASSYLACKLLEADDNSTSHYLASCDTALIIGNINPEGSSLPNAIAYDPTKWSNYTQIFRTPLSITRTAKLTRLRTGDAYTEAKREALEMHSVEMEKAFMWGIKTEGIGDNGKPERTTMGLVPAIKSGAAANVSDYSLNTSYSGKTWLQGGEDFIDTYLEQIFRYGDTQKLAYVGSGALLGINKLVKSIGRFEFLPSTKDYGIQTVSWVTPFGTIELVTHPLFSYETTTRYAMVIFEPKNLIYRFITDTTFQPDTSSGLAAVDGQNEGFLTECGLEYHHPVAWGYLNGIGQDNTV